MEYMKKIVLFNTTLLDISASPSVFNKTNPVLE